jgi:hypothetical protein
MTMKDLYTLFTSKKEYVPVGPRTSFKYKPSEAGEISIGGRESARNLPTEE